MSTSNLFASILDAGRKASVQESDSIDEMEKDMDKEDKKKKDDEDGEDDDKDMDFDEKKGYKKESVDAMIDAVLNGTPISEIIG